MLIRKGCIEGLATSVKGFCELSDLLSYRQIGDSQLAQIMVEIAEHNGAEVLAQGATGSLILPQSTEGQNHMQNHEFETAFNRIRHMEMRIELRLPRLRHNSLIKGTRGPAAVVSSEQSVENHHSLPAVLVQDLSLAKRLLSRVTHVAAATKIGSFTQQVKGSLAWSILQVSLAVRCFVTDCLPWG